MKELLHYILSHIVDDPKELKIEEEQKETETVLNVMLPQEQRALVIGKRGMNIRSIRNLKRQVRIMNYLRM